MHTHYGFEINDDIKIGEHIYYISDMGYVNVSDGTKLGHIEDCLENGRSLWQLFESIDSQ